jgi:hypothetical protein
VSQDELDEIDHHVVAIAAGAVSYQPKSIPVLGTGLKSGIGLLLQRPGTATLRELRAALS